VIIFFFLYLEKRSPIIIIILLLCFLVGESWLCMLLDLVSKPNLSLVMLEGKITFVKCVWDNFYAPILTLPINFWNILVTACVASVLPTTLDCPVSYDNHYWDTCLCTVYQFFDNRRVGASTFFLLIEVSIDYFTVVCLVAWPFNEGEAEGDLVMMETLKRLLCKFLLISKRTGSLT